VIAADVQVAQPIADPAATPGSTKPAGAQLIAAFPPRPVAASWPATEASRSVVVNPVLSAPFALDNPNSQRNRRLEVLAVLGWLRNQPGDSWQQRWRASGAPPVLKRRDGVPRTHQFLVTLTVHTNTINPAMTPTTPSATSMTNRPAVVVIQRDGQHKAADGSCWRVFRSTPVALCCL
jgi:hypothetical protein